MKPGMLWRLRLLISRCYIEKLAGKKRSQQCTHGAGKYAHTQPPTKDRQTTTHKQRYKTKHKTNSTHAPAHTHTPPTETHTHKCVRTRKSHLRPKAQNPNPQSEPHALRFKQQGPSPAAHENMSQRAEPTFSPTPRKPHAPTLKSKPRNP